MNNILIVDDEQIVSNVLQKILSRFGYHAEIAPGGRAGIRMFDTETFDLVITDIRMAGTDGYDVARHVRNSDRPFTPIIGISGTPWLLEGDEFDRVLPKPFGVETLINAVKNVMRCTARSHKASYSKAASV
jgi:DNA-binding response OmpR family regulator